MAAYPFMQAKARAQDYKSQLILSKGFAGIIHNLTDYFFVLGRRTSGISAPFRHCATPEKKCKHPRLALNEKKGAETRTNDAGLSNQAIAEHSSGPHWCSSYDETSSHGDATPSAAKQSWGCLQRL